MFQRDRAVEQIPMDHGRTVAISIAGAEHGWPVFLLHGTPGSRTGPHPRPGVLYRRGVRLISYDRPGYGASARQAGRRVVDAAHDVARIAEKLGIERFSVVGRSGGGPHALACAALFPDHVHRVATLVSLAPRTADIDWSSGMTDDNAAVFGKAADLDATALTARLLWRAHRTAREPRSLLDQLLGEVSRADRLVLDDVRLQELLVSSYGEAFRHGPYGWIDDLIALGGDWGFDLAHIKAPAYVWHGGADRFAPASHARWLAANIPDAVLDLQADEAHFGAIQVLPKVLTWLSADTRPAAEPPSPSVLPTRSEGQRIDDPRDAAVLAKR